MDREQLRRLIDLHAIHRVPPGQSPLPGKDPGTTYTWQFYLRRVLYRTDALRFIANEFVSQFQEISVATPFQIAGVESASVPILTAIKFRWPELNAFSIRKHQKSYGLKNWIEGIPNELPVVLVDDLMSGTHATYFHGRSVLQHEGIPILDRAFCVVNKRYRDAPGFDQIRIHSMKARLHYVFTLDDFNLG